MPLPPYYDPLGEYEPNTVIYTLTVRCPSRPPPKWLPSIFTREPVVYPKSGYAHTIKPVDTNPDLDCFEYKHLDEMSVKTIDIRSAYFPAEMRCIHTQNESRKCEKGCYVLEKGGDIRRWTCKREDCQGHVYCGLVKKDEEGRACFGKKNNRMVCLENPFVK